MTEEIQVPFVSYNYITSTYTMQIAQFDFKLLQFPSNLRRKDFKLLPFDRNRELKIVNLVKTLFLQFILLQ